MIGPDDIGDRRPANHTPTIALSIAAVLLLIVGALSYRDFVRSSLEKEFAEKEARLLQRNGLGPVSPMVSAQQTGQAVPQVGVEATSPGFGYKPPTGTVLYDAQGNPVYLTEGQAYTQVTGQQTESTLPAPVDPDISRMRNSLDQARQQGQLTEQRYNQLAGNATDPLAREAAAVAESGLNAPVDPATSGTAAITSELPDFLRNAVENPPGGNPEVEERLDRMRAQVMAAPSLAKVTSFDKDWGIVTFNAGAVQGVKVDQRFAVRRGGDILGWVKVDQVDDQQSIAVLVTKNRDSDTALKPDVGDDLIDFELF